MEQNVERDGLGRQCRAHSSAHREAAAANLPPKRGRRRQAPPPVQGTHDQEAGGQARVSDDHVQDDHKLM
ncbi:hypothetical protein A2U01_0073505 [Trifolium medium]|uniref:Uncharacterized protein n=1 Tax=Trifolium medium TaxID=97028 RepID=A0A392STT7_9FABA|nr:hypothetical protein [Trifolium medium]